MYIYFERSEKEKLLKMFEKFCYEKFCFGFFLKAETFFTKVYYERQGLLHSF